MVPPMAISARVWRSEPGPLSLLLVTEIVSADAAQADLDRLQFREQLGGRPVGFHPGRGVQIPALPRGATMAVNADGLGNGNRLRVGFDFSNRLDRFRSLTVRFGFEQLTR